MASIVIHDLEMNSELDENALSSVVGGYLQYELKNVQITSYQLGVSGDEVVAASRTFGAGNHEYLGEPNTETR